MAVLLIAGLILALCAQELGHLLIWEDPGDAFDAFIIRTWTGCLALASLLLLLSLFLPLQPWGALMVVAGAIPGLCRLRPRHISLSGTAAAAGVACAVSGVVGLYDSGLYHLPFIRMLRAYGTLPGAGLLHHRFGFSSSWFALNASQEPSFLDGRMAAAATGLLLVLATLHLASALRRIAAGSAEPSCWFLIGAWPVVFYDAMLQTTAVSPSPNLALEVSLVWIGWLHLRGMRASAALTAAAAVCVKFSALPAAVLLLFRGRPKALAIGALLAAPSFLANFTTTGCPAFPSKPCFATAHSVGPAESVRTATEVREWARYDGPSPAGARFLDVSWIPAWTHRARVGLILTAASSLALLLRRLFPPPARVAFLGLAFVLIAAPDPRFFNGYVAMLCGSALAAFARTVSFPRVPWRLVAAALWIAYALARDIVRPEPSGPGWPERLLLPQLTRTAVTGLWTLPPNQPLRHPLAGDQCWNTDFPCTPYPLPAGMRLCVPDQGLTGGICLDPPR